MEINMATDFKFYDQQVKNFNDYYGVDFDMGSFDAETWTTEPNKAYKENFMELYQTALGNWADGKIKNFSAENMLSEFESIMSSYRNVYTERNQKSGLSPLGGLSAKQMLKDVKSEITDKLPKTKAVFAKQRYMNGQLPIRKMVAYAKEAFANGKEPTLEQATVIASYAMGLRLAHESRSPISKFFSYIFRGNAEKREYKAMENMLKGMKDKDILKAATQAAGRSHNAFAEIKEDIDSGIKTASLYSNSAASNADKQKIHIDVKELEGNTKKSERIKESPTVTKEKNLG